MSKEQMQEYSSYKDAAWISKYMQMHRYVPEADVEEEKTDTEIRMIKGDITKITDAL